MGIGDEPLAEKKENRGRNAGEMMMMMMMQETNSQKSKSKGVRRKME